jgi:three-Cys-motif partner protein
MVKESEFFKSKKAWSEIKDDVLSYYLPIYLSKVATLRKEIVLIDAFAGPGKYEDGRWGSPLIIYNAAHTRVQGKYLAIFMNKYKNHHRTLVSLVEQLNDSSLLPIPGESQTLLQVILQKLRDQTLFVYLDPFGIKGCEFATLRPFLERDKRYSTELVLNMNMPIIHRLGGKPQRKDEKLPGITVNWHKRLSLVLNGDYWKEILWDKSLSPEQKEIVIMGRYREELRKYLPYAGSCPVRAGPRQRIKYFITFCSRHEDAQLLMNNAMCMAYSKAMHGAEYAGTLFAGLDWKEMRQSREVKELDGIVLEYIKRELGLTRLDYWKRIVDTHFMRFLDSEYKDKVQELYDKGRIDSPTSRRKKRLNDNCVLYLREDADAHNQART